MIQQRITRGSRQRWLQFSQSKSAKPSSARLMSMRSLLRRLLTMLLNLTPEWWLENLTAHLIKRGKFPEVLARVALKIWWFKPLTILWSTKKTLKSKLNRIYRCSLYRSPKPRNLRNTVAWLNRNHNEWRELSAQDLKVSGRWLKLRGKDWSRALNTRLNLLPVSTQTFRNLRLWADQLANSHKLNRWIRLLWKSLKARF